MTFACNSRHLTRVAANVTALALTLGCGKASDTPDKVGYITVGPDYVSATFVIGTALTCAESAEGNCVLRECERGTSPEQLSAGTIEVVGPSGSCELTAGTDPDPPRYAQCHSDSELWDLAAGGELTVEASGDVVPEFSEVFAAPDTVAVTAPDPDLQLDEAGDEVANALPRTSDLEIEWTGGGAGRIVASTATAPEGAAFVALDCEAASEAGSLEIPASLMQQLGPSLALLSVRHVSATSVDVEDWTIRLEAGAGVAFYSLGY